MNINTPSVNLKETQQQSKRNNVKQESSVKFSEELKELKEAKSDEKEVEESKKPAKNNAEDVKTKEAEENKKLVDEKALDEAMQDMNELVNELNQSDEKNTSSIKNSQISADNKLEGDKLINNEFNIQENKDLMPQMNPGMNFSGDQPFSSFMNNNTNQGSRKQLAATETDLAEEAAILSTMAENIAIANRNQMMNKSENKIDKPEMVNAKSRETSLIAEQIVKYDSIIMKQADVEVFATLVNKGEVNLNDIAPNIAQGATQVSKTLADMLAKSMENNQPLRIDFDNDISVIIRISRDGKISADFLPSTQIAEAYLKENLPLLRQRFEDNNIEYENLNHRNSKEREKEDNRKKGRNNE